MDITMQLAYDSPDTVREIFSEYMDMLLTNDPSFAEFLALQNYDAELQDLEYKYGLPDGRLYLAHCDGKLAGCIALRKLDDTTGEFKRVYVKPEFRGRHIGKKMVLHLIQDAKEIGYTRLLLDTLPFLKTAIKMYQKLGFYEIPSYNNSPMDSSIFLRLDL